MNEYEAIAVYACFSFIVFGFAMIWRFHRHTIMKRFHLLNYHKDKSTQTSFRP